MAMTRKHYNAIADILNGEARCHPEARTKAVIRNIVLSLADVMAQDNERFQREKFYYSCGMSYDSIDGWVM